MMTLWGYHLIHRTDDSAHFKVEDPHGNIEYPFTMKTRTKWSKNVKRMKHCPDQILFASMDWKTCVILWYAIYLEQWLGIHPNAKHLFTSNAHEKKGPASVKRRYGNRISKVVWEKQEFKDLEDETAETRKGLGNALFKDD